MRAPANFPVEGPGGTKPFRTALIEDYSLGAAPDMLFELMSYIVGGERRKKLKALAKGRGSGRRCRRPRRADGARDFRTGASRSGSLPRVSGAAAAAALFDLVARRSRRRVELHLTVDAVRYDA